MPLKNNNFLKFFAVLLFSMELLAPVFLYSPSEKLDAETTQKSLHDVSHQFNLLTYLLCEEAGSEEERGGKEHKVFLILVYVSPVEIFSLIKRAETFTIEADPSELIASQPSLISLLGTYRI